MIVDHYEQIERAPFGPEDFLTTIPNWLIRQICHPNSRRGPKIPSYHSTIKSPWTYPGYDGNVYTDYHDNDSLQGSLSENEYRFFEGFAYNHYSDGCCRWCGAWIKGEKQRKKHLREECHCANALTTIFKWALAQKPWHCFVCGSVTSHKRWGFPICNNQKCVREWKFDANTSHKTWMDAVKGARKQGLLSAYEPGGKR